MFYRSAVSPGSIPIGIRFCLLFISRPTVGKLTCSTPFPPFFYCSVYYKEKNISVCACARACVCVSRFWGNILAFSVSFSFVCVCVSDVG